MSYWGPNVCANARTDMRMMQRSVGGKGVFPSVAGLSPEWCSGDVNIGNKWRKRARIQRLAHNNRWLR